MVSDGTAEDRSKLIAGNFWQRDYQDGRASQAMQNLIDSLRSFASADSNNLSTIFFDDPSAMGGRDKFMAERLSAAITQSPESFVVGSLRGQKLRSFNR